jgi:hypothetical protein
MIFEAKGDFRPRKGKFHLRAAASVAAGEARIESNQAKPGVHI